MIQNIIQLKSKPLICSHARTYLTHTDWARNSSKPTLISKPTTWTDPGSDQDKNTWFYIISIPSRHFSTCIQASPWHKNRPATSSIRSILDVFKSLEWHSSTFEAALFRMQSKMIHVHVQLPHEDMRVFQARV